ncbi:MAG: NfeD family protein [Chloroflexi bacterium]|nr:NfeD family protein [Chloroflexota bacterium]
MCHLVLFLPVLGLPVFWLMPVGYSIPIYAAILLLSLPLYWLVMRGMQRPLAVGIESIVGARVEVVKKLGLRRTGMYLVRSHGELWTAFGSAGFEAGDRAIVVSFEGNCLVVGPADDTKKASAHPPLNHAGQRVDTE